MKDIIKNIIIFAAIIFLCQCKKEQIVPYPNKNIVEDNAQAAMYFHTVFREAENAWALIDSVDYVEGVYNDPANTMTVYKEMTYTESTKTVTIEYNNWLTNHLLLMGKIIVIFNRDSYRKNGMSATVRLTGFSINGQDVVGESSIKFTGNVDKDQYTFSLDDAAIYEMGVSMPVLITSSISNGQYERTEGRETFTQDDDVWVFYGVMKGQLRNNPDLKYTNTVSATSTYTINGENRNGKVHYNMACKTARQGMSQIQIKGRSDIIFIYNCYECYLESVTHVE